MFVEEYSLVVKADHDGVNEYLSSTKNELGDSAFTRSGKLAARFDEGDARSLIEQGHLSGRSDVSIVGVSIGPVRSHFDKHGFTVSQQVILSDLPNMGGVVDGVSINSSFAQEMLGTCALPSSMSRIFLVTRIFVAKGIRNFGVAERLLAELCHNVDDQDAPVILLAEVSPYDETIDRRRLKDLFEENGFKCEGEHLLVRNNSPREVD